MLEQVDTEVKAAGAGSWRAADIALAASALFFVAISLLFAFAAYVDRDEGFYLLASHRVYDGALPYRDFPYFQGPLLPYVFGIPQQLFGESLLVGRLSSVALAATGAALAAYVARRLAGSAAAAVALLLVAVAPEYMLVSSTARAEALVTPLVAASLALLLRFQRGLLGFILPPLPLLLGAGVRLSFFPAFVLLALYGGWRLRPSRRDLAVGIGCFAAVAAILYGPVLIQAAHRTVFDAWSAQAYRQTQYHATDISLAMRLKDRIGGIQITFNAFFLVIVPALVVGAWIVREALDGWRPTSEPADDDIRQPCAVIIAVALAIWLPTLVLDLQQSRYFVPSYLPLAIVTGVATVCGIRTGARAVIEMRRESAAGPVGRYDHPGRRQLAVVPGLVAALLVLAVMFNGVFASDLLAPGDPPVSATNDAGHYIESLLRPGETLVTFNTTLAIAAKREVAPGLEMGYLSFFPRLDSRAANDRGVVNRDGLEARMLAPSNSVVALDDFDLNIISGASPDRVQTTAVGGRPFQVIPKLLGTYELARTYPAFGQYHSQLYVLKRIGR